MKDVSLLPPRKMDHTDLTLPVWKLWIVKLQYYIILCVRMRVSFFLLMMSNTESCLFKFCSKLFQIPKLNYLHTNWKSSNHDVSFAKNVSIRFWKYKWHTLSSYFWLNIILIEYATNKIWLFLTCELKFILQMQF